MTLLNGKETSDKIKEEIALEVEQVLARGEKRPHLAAILVGEDGASQTYVNSKVKSCEKVGFESTLIRMPDNTSEEELVKEVHGLNNNDEIDGFIIQLPLPKHINSDKIINAIDPNKDVDGFHPENAGLLSIGRPRFIPCTPKGIMRILNHYQINLKGKHVVVIGRSNIVGRPISILTSLKSEWANGTTTICHSGTPDIEFHTKKADVVVVALGIPGFLTSKMVKDNAIIIDVGINRVDDDSVKGYTLIGDVEWEGVKKIASAITPVPGGVGPMTIAMLVENTIEAASDH